MAKRQRQGKLQVKHSTIQGLRQALERLCGCDEVRTCIPGRIRRTGRLRRGPLLTVQARTATGVKLAAHGNGVVQEVFVVTAAPDVVAQLVRSIGGAGDVGPGP